MTLLTVWASVDPHGPSALYIATESRITWARQDKWDFAYKVFALQNHPDILGYCGDVLFTTQALAQITNLADTMVLFQPESSSETKFAAISQCVMKAFDTFPKNRALPEFTIVHGSRSVDRSFHCFALSYREERWTTEEIPLPPQSQVIQVYGSGREAFKRTYELCQASDLQNLSAGVFVSFCDSISSCDDDQSFGGAPQLVGLYRGGNGRVFGVIYKGHRYVLGMEPIVHENLNAIQWRNELFERCDGETLQRLSEAPRQPRPRNFSSRRV